MLHCHAKPLLSCAMMPIALLLLAFLSLSPSVARASEEYPIKAAFVLNFLRYISFAEERAEITLCISGGPSVAEAFAPLSEKRVRNMRIVVHNVDHSFEGCQALFVAEDAFKSLADELTALRERGVLTIGENSGFNQHGGVIEMHESGNRIRFAINISAARGARLTVSSRLLQLASSTTD